MLGESAIHDDGFQFFLTLKIENEINQLLKDMMILSECIVTHERWRRDQSWYNAKTTVKISNFIEGYAMYCPFTFKMAKKVYTERKNRYDLLMSLSENALKSAKEDYAKYPTQKFNRPDTEDIEREFVIVDFD